MKEYKKWWNRQGSRIHKLSISMNNPGGKNYQEGTIEGWKAALEWAKKKGYHIEETEGEYSQALIDAIQKELKEAEEPL